ncbi:hypothetical protein, partial [Gilliamella sp. B3372]
GQSVSRNSVLTTCNSPYRVTLSNNNGTLATRYGVPRSSSFSASRVTYYVNPKAAPVVCFARPNLNYGSSRYAGPSSMWDPANGFLTQKTDPSFYGQNFPTTGANRLHFDLLISGSDQPLSWSPVSQGGITATMTNSTATSVHVTLTGPAATGAQLSSDNPTPLDKPTLPQTFELIGRDGSGSPVVKYGFTLKQWFVVRHDGAARFYNGYYRASSWCGGITYGMPTVADLTNASCNNFSPCMGAVGANPRSPNNWYQRHIGAGFFTEWGNMRYPGFSNDFAWTRDARLINNSLDYFPVFMGNGKVDTQSHIYHYAALCVVGRSQ